MFNKINDASLIKVRLFFNSIKEKMLNEQQLDFYIKIRIN